MPRAPDRDSVHFQTRCPAIDRQWPSVHVSGLNSDDTIHAQGRLIQVPDALSPNPGWLDQKRLGRKLHRLDTVVWSLSGDMRFPKPAAPESDPYPRDLD